MAHIDEENWEPQMDRLSWSRLESLLPEAQVTVVPAGAIEQHGHHLPLRTDTMNVEAVAIDACRRERSFMAPVITYGVSTNHSAFCGTLTLRPQTLVNILQDVVSSLVRHGIKRVLLLNGNGGNATAMHYAAEELRRQWPETRIGLSDIGEMHPEVPTQSGIVYHADETETSHSLHVAPHLVDRSQLTDEVSDQFRAYYERYYKPAAAMRGLVSYGLPPTETLSSSGVMGTASFGSEELGRLWHQALVDDVVLAIQDLKTRALP
jgi:creatinine amidohydrolase